METSNSPISYKSDVIYEIDTGMVSKKVDTASSLNEKLISNEKPKDDPKNSSRILGFATIQKMINRFLLEKQISKESLAVLLEITTAELESLLAGTLSSSRLLAKVNLPLVRLYCGTKWW